MRNAVVLSISIFVLLLAVHLGHAQQQGFTTSELQERFSESVKSLPNVIQATWQSPVDLWVYADGVDKSGAESIAEKITLLAQSEFGQSFCVHVHNGNFKPLATKCWSAL